MSIDANACSVHVWLLYEMMDGNWLPLSNSPNWWRPRTIQCKFGTFQCNAKVPTGPSGPVHYPVQAALSSTAAPTGAYN